MGADRAERAAAYGEDNAAGDLGERPPSLRASWSISEAGHLVH